MQQVLWPIWQFWSVNKKITTNNQNCWLWIIMTQEQLETSVWKQFGLHSPWQYSQQTQGSYSTASAHLGSHILELPLKNRVHGKTLKAAITSSGCNSVACRNTSTYSASEIKKKGTRRDQEHLMGTCLCIHTRWITEEKYTCWAVLAVTFFSLPFHQNVLSGPFSKLFQPFFIK